MLNSKPTLSGTMFRSLRQPGGNKKLIKLSLGNKLLIKYKTFYCKIIMHVSPTIIYAQHLFIQLIQDSFLNL